MTSRSSHALAALALAALACSLSPGGDPEVTTTEATVAGAGVPISKATSTPVVETQPATDMPMEPTEPQDAPSATPPGATPRAATPTLGGSSDVELVDIHVIPEVNLLIGLAQNTSGRDLCCLSLTFNFFDSGGAVVQTKYGSGLLRSLPAGGMLPFEASFPGGVPVTAESVAVAAEWQEADPSFPWVRQGFRIANLQGEKGEFSYTIGGEFENTSGVEAEFVALAGIVFGADGGLIGQTLTTLENIGPGQSAPFNMSIGLDKLAEEVQSFEVLVEARFES